MRLSGPEPFLLVTCICAPKSTHNHQKSKGARGGGMANCFLRRGNRGGARGDVKWSYLGEEQRTISVGLGVYPSQCCAFPSKILGKNKWRKVRQIRLQEEEGRRKNE